MNVKLIVTLLTSILIVAACNGTDSHDEDLNEDHSDETEHTGHESQGEIATLDVDLQLPDTVAVGEEIDISAHVTYDGEDELNADKVEFEIKRDDETLDEIEADHDENGVYTIQYTFDETGEYEVIAHTDAHHLHTMPSATINVEE